MKTLACLALIPTLIAPTQDPPGDNVCLGSITGMNNPPTAWLACAQQDCPSDCEIRHRIISGGGFGFYCKCPEALQITPCCTLVLVILPGEEPLPELVGECDAVGGSCDADDNCTMMDVYSDGTLLEAWCTPEN
jgi:hypothetical protein